MNELNIINDYFQTKPPTLVLSKQFFMKNNYISNYAEKSELSKMIEDAVETYCSGKEKQFNKFPFLTNELEKLFKHVEKYEENSIDTAVFVYLLFLHERRLLNATFDLYQQMISTNFYGIPDVLIEKGIITKGTCNTHAFQLFVKALAKWYTTMEIISLQLNVLSKVFHIQIDSNISKSISGNQHFSSKKGLFCAQNRLKWMNWGMGWLTFSTYDSDFHTLHWIYNWMNGCFLSSLFFHVLKEGFNNDIKSIQNSLQREEDEVGLIGIIKNLQKMILDINAVKPKVYELLDLKVASSMQQYLIDNNVIPSVEEQKDDEETPGNTHIQTKNAKAIEKAMKTELKNARIQKTWDWEEIDKEDFETPQPGNNVTKK